MKPAMFDRDPLSALEAIAAAQWLAFAPLAFQAVTVMRDRGVLAAFDDAPHGRSIDEVAAATGLSVYAVRVLLEAGLGLRVVWRQDGRFHLGKLGHVLLEDDMTRVNFNFNRDVCYRAAAHLDASLAEGRPAGLHELGPWGTLYEGLSVLPEPARSSWHAFDHFYSDLAFQSVCEKLERTPPLRLLDIGCNTGKWAELCLNRLQSTEIGLADLPLQLDRARARLSTSSQLHRVRFHPVNILDPRMELPSGYDLIWLSQFLDCFSENQIVAILSSVRATIAPGARVWILELFWDRQRFEAAAVSLQLTSLYFACVANGNSQMYDSSVFISLIERAGFKICEVTDHVGEFHTLLECRSFS